MPIYEYACTSCGVLFEELRPAGRCSEAAACRNCGDAATRRVSGFATPARGRSRSQIVRDDAMRTLLPYFAARD